MKPFSKKIFIPVQVLLLMSWYALTNTAITVLFEVIFITLLMIDKLGKGIVLRETIALHTSFILLLMPLVGYTYYTSSNSLSNIWVKYMPIPQEIYFSFTVPAVLLFNLVLCWPIQNKKNKDEGHYFIEKWNLIIYKLNKSSIEGSAFIIIGTTLFLFSKFLPSSLSYLGFIGFLTSFTGFLMLYFKEKTKNRKLFIAYFIIFLSYITLDSGMFTIVVYMSMTIFSFLFLGFKIRFWQKLMLFSLLLFTVVLIQLAKGAFRQATWTSDYQDNKAVLFGGLLVNQITKGTSDLSDDKLFFLYVRANQGFIVANVMDYIPKNKPFDEGLYLFKTFLSSFVPRLLWPDKPMAGGKFTTKYFTGNDLVGNTSMNVSPVGEAYGSFGPTGGIIYLVFLALFIRAVYSKIFSLSDKIPFIIFWIPVLFFQVTYSMETDSLQIFNSVIKSIFFVTILYYIKPSLFGTAK